MPTQEHLVEKAVGEAVRAHAGQLDKQGVPYIRHLIAVASHATSDLDFIVSMLHDIVEDGGWTVALVRAEFGDVVADAVGALSRTPNEIYGDYIERVATNAIATRVKVADLSHNYGRLSWLSHSHQRRLGPRYEAALQRLSGGAMYPLAARSPAPSDATFCESCERRVETLQETIRALNEAEADRDAANKRAERFADDVARLLLQIRAAPSETASCKHGYVQPCTLCTLEKTFSATASFVAEVRSTVPALVNTASDHVEFPAAPSDEPHECYDPLCNCGGLGDCIDPSCAAPILEEREATPIDEMAMCECGHVKQDHTADGVCLEVVGEGTERSSRTLCECLDFTLVSPPARPLEDPEEKTDG